MGNAMFQRHARNVFFKNEVMDFFLQWMLGYHSYGGLSIGEGLHIASRIKSGNIASWEKAFADFGAAQAEQARKLMREGDAAAAGQRHLCSFVVLRASIMFMSPHAERFGESIISFEMEFQEAMKAKELPLEALEIPFEQSSLPAYFCPAKDAERSRPLIVVIGGADSFREDLYFFGGAEAIRRGYNALMVDLPGQGKTPARGLALRYDTEKPLKAALDWLNANRGLSDAAIGMYGISGGGYFAMRATAYDKRIRALALSTPIYDMYRVITSMIPKAMTLLSRFLKYIDKVAAVGVEKSLWQMNVKSYEEVLEKFVNRCSVDIHLVDCPVFAIAGGGEGEELKRQTRLFYEEMKKRHRQSIYREYPAETGADAHCQVNNLVLAHQELLDWFDAVLSPKACLSPPPQP
jgi:pimeloyl-ACP methyl ester carboxylesterase